MTRVSEVTVGAELGFVALRSTTLERLESYCERTHS